MRKRTVVIWIIILIALAVLIIRKLTTKEQFSPGLEDPVVETTSTDTGNISTETALIGSIEPADVVYVYAKAAGDVTEVNVKAGEAVSAGDPICTIDTKQVENAKNEMESAQLSLQKAQEDLARAQVLYAAAGISDQEYQSYVNTAEQAQVSYNSAKTNYETQVEYSSVTASIGGIIELCDVEVHDTMAAGDLICVISGEGARMVSFSVTERIRAYLNVGDTIRIEKDDAEFEGTITEVSTMADTETGLFKVKAQVSGDSDIGPLLPTGSMVKLYVTSSHADDVMRIPLDCVYYDGGQSYVYTLDSDDVIHKVQIETGVQDEEYIQVISGISADDRIVSTWSSELEEGQHVRVVESSEAESSDAEGSEAESSDAESSGTENSETAGSEEESGENGTSGAAQQASSSAAQDHTAQ